MTWSKTKLYLHITCFYCGLCISIKYYSFMSTLVGSSWYSWWIFTKAQVIAHYTYCFTVKIAVGYLIIVKAFWGPSRWISSEYIYSAPREHISTFFYSIIFKFLTFLTDILHKELTDVNSHAYFCLNYCVL